MHCRAPDWYTESAIFSERATDSSRERIETAVCEQCLSLESNNHEKGFSSIAVAVFAACERGSEFCPATKTAKACAAWHNRSRAGEARGHQRATSPAADHRDGQEGPVRKRPYPGRLYDPGRQSTAANRFVHERRK